MKSKWYFGFLILALVGCGVETKLEPLAPDGMKAVATGFPAPVPAPTAPPSEYDWCVALCVLSPDPVACAQGCALAYPD